MEKSNNKRKESKKMEEHKNLAGCVTCELVRELRKREGVSVHIAEPNKDMEISVNGPAIVLVVLD